MNVILIIVFICFFLIQLILGWSSADARRKLPKKYSFILGEQEEVSDILERYLKKYPKIVIRGADFKKDIAFASENHIFVNKKVLHKSDIFSIFSILLQLNLTHKTRAFLREFFKYQNIFFGIEIFLFILGVILSQESYSSWLLYLALFAEFIVFAITIYTFLSYKEFLKFVKEDFKKYIKIDEVEEARVEALADESKYCVFEYPMDIVWKLLQFVKP